ncbi:class I tRNA ligase family protein, partial [Clostridioides difficile]
LLYRGHRVSPYCPSCQTTLSSHEVAQGYKDVKDLSATAKFKLNDSGEFVLAWTTTPWTLPSHVALAVNPDMDYSRVRQGDEVYIMATNLVKKVMKDTKGEYEIIGALKGADLVGKTYDPPFNYV